MTKVRWVKVEAGVYERADGRFRVERGWANEPCENPHPGCPGGELHERPCWLIRERRGAAWMPITWEQDVVGSLAEGKEIVGR